MGKALQLLRLHLTIVAVRAAGSVVESVEKRFRSGLVAPKARASHQKKKTLQAADCVLVAIPS